MHVRIQHGQHQLLQGRRRHLHRKLQTDPDPGHAESIDPAKIYPRRRADQYNEEVVRLGVSRMEESMKNIAVMILLIASAILLSGSPSAARSNQGMSGRYACECMSGNTGVGGTCSTTTKSDGSVSCGKNAGDTCTATCTMMTFTHGVTDGSIAISPGKGGTPQKSAPTLKSQ